MPQSHDDALLAGEVALAMARLRARLRRESAATAGEWSMAQVTILARIVDEGPITASDIARAEHVRPQSAAETLNLLKKAGLVEAAPDPKDGRKVLIRANDKGVALVRSVSRSREAWLSRAISAELDEQDKSALTAATAMLRRLAGATLD